MLCHLSESSSLLFYPESFSLGWSSLHSEHLALVLAMRFSIAFTERSLSGLEGKMFIMRMGISELGKAWIEGMEKISRARAFFFFFFNRARAFNAQMQN